MKFLRNAATLFVLTKIYCSNIVTFKLGTMHPYSSRGYKMAGGQKRGQKMSLLALGSLNFQFRPGKICFGPQSLPPTILLHLELQGCIDLI